jgi:hypothetical protein
MNNPKNTKEGTAENSKNSENNKKMSFVWEVEDDERAHEERWVLLCVPATT